MVRPGRDWEDSFVGPVQWLAALSQIFMDMVWSNNGSPAPAAGNFSPANEVGGGVDLICLGAADNDWIAMHWGGNYPVLLRLSPHFHVMNSFETPTEMFALSGLVGASGLQTGNGAAWTTPDDGVWVQFDTDDDPNNLKFITRSGGAQTETLLGAPPTGHFGFHIQVSDAGDSVSLILKGTKVATHTTHLTTVQLKPLYMIMTRVDAGGAKNIHLHDFWMNMDRGW